MDGRLIRNGHGLESLHYEEGMLRTSDARFVLHWITPHQTPEQVPLNYCAVTGGGYDASEKRWRLELRDTLGDDSAEARSRWVVNCAGAWADPVNELFGIETPYKHVLSKGVYLGVPVRPSMRRPWCSRWATMAMPSPIHRGDRYPCGGRPRRGLRTSTPAAP